MRTVAKRRSRGRLWIGIGAIAIWFAVFASVVVGDLSSPLLAGDDTDVWDYTGFYFSQYLRWEWLGGVLPIPQLELVNNAVFYPQGTTSVFQAWGMERDLLCGWLWGSLGPGPWAKLYFLGSVAVGLGGTAALLWQELGPARSLGTACIATLFNFYGLVRKFPYHANISVFHWTLLSIVTDFVIVSQVVRRERVSLAWILWRIALIFLVLGQDLGYVAGYGLMSIVVCQGYVLSLLLWRSLKQRKPKNIPGSFLKNKTFKITFQGKLFTLFSILAIAWGVWLYLPLVLQIYTTATQFEFSDVYGRVWASNPLRLLIPVLPAFNPDTLSGVIPAVIEDPWDGVTGLFIVAIAALGLWQSRQNWRIYLPFLVMLGLILAYHPQDFPTLKVFPWSRFNRVGGRVTLLLPIFGALFASGFQYQRWPKPWRGKMAIALLFLGSLELTTAYGLKLGDRLPPIPTQTENYFATVRDAPGEAILDWPICAIGGNGIGGIDGLCPYASTDPAIPWLSRFHEKKVMGQYFGRLHPSQIQPYLAMGLHRLMQPNHPDLYRATQERRCFKPGEWDFFERLYRSQSFAGLQLHRDRLPDECYREFIRRYGEPIAIATLPKMGTLAFVPNTPENLDTVPEISPKLSFNPTFDDPELGHPEGVDLMDVAIARGLDTIGLSRVRERESGRWRWAIGDQMVLTLRLGAPHNIKLKFGGIAEAPDQTIAIKIHTQGKTSDRTFDAPLDQAINHAVEFAAPSGETVIEFKFERAVVGQSTSPAAGDRPLAFRFTTLKLVPNKLVPNSR